MKVRKASFVILTLLCAVHFGGSAGADLGKVEYWNASFEENKGQKIDVTEKSTSSNYLPDSGAKLLIYGWGPTIGNPIPHAIGPIGIEQNKACVLEFCFEASATMTNDKDNVIDINWRGPEGGDSSYTPFDSSRRNFFMRQHPEGPRAGTSEEDTSIYDLLDLTNDFTANASITLPDITASTPRSPAIYDKWQKIISNFADIVPSVFDGKLPDGKVTLVDFTLISQYWLRNDCGPGNNWCNGADLTRDGNVNEVDLTASTEQWLVDPNTIR